MVFAVPQTQTLGSLDDVFRPPHLHLTSVFTELTPARGVTFPLARGSPVWLISGTNLVGIRAVEFPWNRGVDVGALFMQLFEW